jgi:hypothetical protein
LIPSPKIRPFLTISSQTIGWAIISVFLLLDYPSNSKRLTERQRAIAVARLQRDSVATRADGEKIGKRQSFLLAVRDWRTWGFVCGYMVSRVDSFQREDG